MPRFSLGSGYFASVAETLDSAPKRELRAVLDARPVTEAELRRLEEGRACALILAGQLEEEERLAAALRRVNELRPDLEEI
jgi:hypothetical protein